ncbi:MAG: hypothetical protein KAS94_07410 [Desulfobulbaceae bacterium]|nr:hypothetical protein [Desulfobulbaceae bacterium]
MNHKRNHLVEESYSGTYVEVPAFFGLHHQHNNIDTTELRLNHLAMTCLS